MQVCAFVVGKESEKQLPELAKAKSKVVAVLHLYTYHFPQHFADYRDQAFQLIWQFVELNTVQASAKLTKGVMDYIAKSVPAPDRKPFIEANLLKLFQNVVMPAIAVTEEEIDEFEAEPDIYLRNDLEEADA